MFHLPKMRGLVAALTMLTSFVPLFSQDLQKIGHLSYAPATLAGCWHYVDSTGGEWALVGTSNGLSIVDVNDPFQPVERFSVPGINNNWREVSTWAGYAYVGSEAFFSGITIVDLREMPDTIRWKVWRGDSVYDSLVVKSHALKAEDGYLYIFGGGIVTNGATIADLSDPWNPEIVGQYTNEYVHDGFIRGDTLWTSEIYQGRFGVVDISDKSNPVLMATQPTPGAFNHNTGLSDDSKTIFAADETLGAPLAAFDVSQLDDITLLDTYLASRKPEGEVHNVRVLNDFLVNACYRGQLTLVDATRPGNMIETAWDSLGNSLVWDADPYLPSGIILATAKSEGLYIYQKPAYTNACWLEGNVVDGATGFPLANVKVYVLNTLNADTSSANGSYKTGNATPGTFEVYAFREGYAPANITGVLLQTNEVTTLDITLFPAVGTQSPDNENFVQVSPAPFNDYIRLEFPEASPFVDKKLNLQMFDFSGKLVKEWQEDSSAPIILSGLRSLPVGAYWLMVDDGKGLSRGLRVLK